MGEFGRTEEPLVYAAWARIVTLEGERAAGGGPTRDELLQRALERALDPDFLRDNAPYFWSAEISNSRLDSYSTVMADSTLRNYAADAEVGVPFRYQHDRSGLHFGMSLAGRFSNGRGDIPARTMADFYTVPGLLVNGVNTDDLIRGQKAGILRDVSVGFAGGRQLCSICGREQVTSFLAMLLGGGDREACPHFPGERYDLTDDTGKKTGESALCYGRIEGAHLVEVSQVDKGSTPNATVLKAQRAAEAGMLVPEVARRLEERYRIALPASQHVWSVGGGNVLHLTPEQVETMRAALVSEHAGRVTSVSLVAPDPDGERAVWSSSYISDLEDNCFAGVEGGGKKDAEGKTTPRSLRHLPHHAKGNGGDGPVDKPHLRAALSRVEQMQNVPDGFQAKCRSHLQAHARKLGMGESGGDGGGDQNTQKAEAMDETRMEPEQERQERVGPPLLLTPGVREALARAGFAPDAELDPAAALETSLCQSADELERLRARERELAPLADDGRAYRSDLIEQTIAWGVRAHGEAFPQETYRELLAGASVEHLRRVRAGFEDKAGALAINVGARTNATVSDDTPRSATRRTDTPPEAYKTR